MGREKLTSRTAVRSRAGVWKRIVFCLACGVVFCTTYALILPAITLEKTELKCPYIVHTHTEACYDPAAAEPKKLLCGQADFVVHTHGPECRDEAGKLCCPLPERKVHGHGPECYTKPLVCDQAEVAGHTHTDACYTWIESPEGEQVQGPLTCGEEETPGHTHTDDCYGPEVLTCGQEEIQLHTHDDGCYAWPEGPDGEKVRGDLICGKLEVLEHVHQTGENGCFQTVTVPDTPTGDPTDQPTQGDPANPDQPADGGTASGEPGEPQPICGKEEHEHEALKCYDSDGDLTCALEAHTHSPECYPNQEEPSEDLPESGGTEEIPENVLEALRKEGIYLGKEQENGTWVAYDAENPNNANVKVTITLPEKALRQHYPFVYEITEGEQNYPKDDVVRAAAGEYNDVKCYTIHWVKIDKDGYTLDTSMEVHQENPASIKLEYLKEEARLKGPQGERKLKVFAFRRADDKQIDQKLGLEEISNAVTNVELDQDTYKSVSFNVTRPCPYVFVSKKVEKGFVEKLGIKSIVDGSAPFDSTGNLVNNTVDVPGNDASENNRVVRSYDTIQYNLSATFAARQSDVKKPNTKMYFELTLSKSATAARFDTSKMLWLGKNYSVEYLDKDDKVVMVMAHDGKFYEPAREDNGDVIRNESGFVQADTSRPLQMNAQVSGSNKEEDSYKVTTGGVIKQRMVGWTTVYANEGSDNVLSGTQSFTAAVEVRNADNGETFAPSFKMWLEGNEENYGSEKQDENTNTWLPAKPVTDNVVDVDTFEGGKYKVTVSAGTNFNLQLKKNNDMSYKNWFDFFTGDLVDKDTREKLTELANLAENHGKSNPADFTEKGIALDDATKARYQNYRYGRITCYGITLQLYNDTDNEPEKNRAAKGMKGFSLPVGDITFDLNFASQAMYDKKPFVGSDKEYTAILWDYNENIPAQTEYKDTYVDPGRENLKTPNDGRGNGGRNLYWDGEERSPYAKGAAPSNYKVYHDGCYYGGDWALVNEKGEKTDINQVANPTVVEGTGENTTYHFKVSDYDFDFDEYHFPKKDAGNSGNVTGYDTYARGFSAGCVQVLSVFPMVQKQSEAEIYLNTTVSNLHLTTRAGQELGVREGDETKYGHEVNERDNTRGDQIVLYAPGTLTKGNSFNGKYTPPKSQVSKEPWTTTEGFLGTEYWSTSYDCSAFAGDDIWIISYGMMASGSDYRTKSMNLLQLFDSRALRIRGEPELYQTYNEEFDEKGTAKYLYAADPDHPKGYDTNENGVLNYMNGVREEDLVYSTNRPDEDGNITVTINGKEESMKCVGVLMELRDCDLLGGKYQYLRIPVKVNGDDPEMVGKTVATVNTFRVWSYDLDGTTWENGKWDDKTGKNKLENYEVPGKNQNKDTYSGELVNRTEGSPPYYVKTEYQDGHQKTGTHAGGTLAGNSLLILSYKAHVGITVDKAGHTSGVGSPTYDQGAGESVVDYRLKNIKTEISDLTGQVDNPLTTLTVKAVLDEGHTGEQRISVSGGSYRMMGYMVNAEEEPEGEEQEISISSDQNHPTRLGYKDNAGKFHVIEIYATRTADGKSVTFQIKRAPVGGQLPDIMFKANFAAATALENNATITANAYISGAGDNRAYDQAKGNMDNVTVGIVLLGGTNLVKAVEEKCIELNGLIHYTVTYSNTGNDAIQTLYLYDLLPANKDIRDSEYRGEVVLRALEVKGKEGVGNSNVGATVYYSKKEYKDLYDQVKTFGGTWDASKNQAENMNADKIEEMLKTNDFEKLGELSGGKFSYDGKFQGMNKEQKTEEMSQITGLYIKVEKLSQGDDLTLTFTVETSGNRANDRYGNVANSWIPNTKTNPLSSKRVQTYAIGRTISGVVWADLDGDGVRRPNEKAIPNVECALFKWDDTESKYVRQTKDIQGNPIGKPSGSETTGAEGTDGTGIVTTDANGAYAFHRLPEGDYVVAFKGDALQPYSDATQYQVNEKNDADTNDGKKITSTFEGIDSSEYRYCIHYSVDNEKITLHAIDEIQSGTVPLTNATETVSNQDLGLVYGYELPETGGEGLLGYVLGGGLLAVGALVGLLLRRGRGAA